MKNNDDALLQQIDH